MQGAVLLLRGQITRLLCSLKEVWAKKYGHALASPVYPGPSPDSLRACRRLDQIQAEMAQMPQVDCPLTHRFTPGLYAREIFMPKGLLVISKIHKTEHPFVVSKGDVSVWIDGVGVKRFKAPYTGITKPGTRRILYMHEDTVWTTFHPTQETDVDRIEQQIIFKHELGQGTPDDALLAQNVIHELMEGAQSCPG